MIETKKVTIRTMPVSLWRQAKSLAAAVDVSLQDFVIDAVREKVALEKAIRPSPKKS